jgi:hypothetical protein
MNLLEPLFWMGCIYFLLLALNLNYEVAPWMSPAKAGCERLLGAI